MTRYRLYRRTLCGDAFEPAYVESAYTAYGRPVSWVELLHLVALIPRDLIRECRYVVREAGASL